MQTCVQLHACPVLSNLSISFSFDAFTLAEAPACESWSPAKKEMEWDGMLQFYYTCSVLD